MSKALFWFVTAGLTLIAAWVLPPAADDLKTLAVRWENTVRQKTEAASYEAQSLIKSIQRNEDWSETETAFYLIDSTGLIRWNTYWITPESAYPVKEKFSLVSSRRGDFLIIRYPMQGRSLDAVIPLIIAGADSEKDWLVGSGVSVHSLAVPGSEPVRLGDNEIFWISRMGPAGHHASVWSWILLVISILSVINSCRIWLSGSRNPWLAIPPVVLVMAGYRWFMVGPGGFPGTRPGDALFDPARFASSAIQDSAGNLLINVICLLFTVLLILPNLNEPLVTFRPAKSQNKVLRNAADVFVLMLLLLIVASPELLIAAVYQNSQVSLDMTNTLGTDRIRVALMLSVVFWIIAAYLMIRGLWRWISVRQLFSGKKFWIELIVASFIVSGLQVFLEIGSVVSCTLAILAVSILSAGTIWRRHFRLAGRSAVASYFLVVVFSVMGALQLRYFELERNYQRLGQVQEELESMQDEFGVYLLRTAADSIRTDPFIRFAVDNPAGDKRLVINRLELEFGGGYFSEYVLSAGIISSAGAVQTGWLPDSLPSLMKGFGLDSVMDSTARIGFIPALKDDLFRKRFLAVVPVGNRVRSHLVMLLEKNAVPAIRGQDALPGMESDNAGPVGAELRKNGEIIRASGLVRWDGSSVTKQPGGKINMDFFAAAGDWIYLESSPAADEFLVVSAEGYKFTRLLTNFSLFLVLGFLFLMIPVVVERLRSLAHHKSITYAGRIRWYLFMAFVIPLAALAAAAVISLDRSTSERAGAVRRELAMRVSGEIERLWLEGGDPAEVRRAVIRESGIAGTEVALYSMDGAILFTSRPGLLADGWLAPRVGYPVLEKLRGGASYAEHRETSGTADYLSSYVLSRRSGLIIGLPDFSYGVQLERNAISGLMVVLPVTAIIFLLFLAFSEAMINRLTSPIRDVSVALRRTSLIYENLPLPSAGKDSDEMGQMIRSYNEMLGKLAISRRELAERERESVWREMARRVAHEIRNPLTPIRLAIQRMQMQVSSGTIKAGPAREALEGILHQTQILNDIATSFSTLAHQPPMRLEPVALATAVNAAVAVFKGSPEGEVVVTDLSDDLVVMADKSFLSRVCSNLVLNAFQSADPMVTVRFSAFSQDGFALMKVSDDGPGIEPEILSRIFDPYFTTRKTGTGLGLTLVQQGLQETGGTISVESVSGEGTCFTIRLPLA